MALLGLLVLAGGPATGWRVARAAFPRHLIAEPVFGLYLAPAKTRFDMVLLADLPEPCRKPLLAIYVPQSRFFVYADQPSADARTLMIGDRNGGVVLVVSAGRCAVADVRPTLWQSRHTPPQPGDPPTLSPTQIRQLFAEVLARYTRAFGGKPLFLAWLDLLTPLARAGCADREEAACPPTYHALPPALQGMLAAYRRG